jgi:hypothetical protein
MALRAVQPEEQEQSTGVSYTWVALANTTLGVLMASLNSSIVLIALPTIFSGIHINPLAAGKSILTDAFPANQCGFGVGINQFTANVGALSSPT